MGTETKRGNVRLTTARVKAAKPAKDITRIYDSVVPGFHVAVFPSGSKSYVVRFQRKDGSKVVVTIGSAAVFTPEAAREEARKLRELHDNGQDARAHVQDKRSAKDVAALAALWKEMYREKLKPTSQCSYDSIIKAIILPALGTRLVKDLDFPSIRALHRKERKEHPIGANRMITVLSRLMSIAEAEGWRPKASNPCYKFPKDDEIPSSRVLSAAELGRLQAAMAALEGAGKLDLIAADLFRFLALSGLRTSEAVRLKWSDINPDQTTMTILVHKTDKKGKNPKVLPLNKPLRDILQRRATTKISPFIFPGLKPGRPDKDGKTQLNPIIGLRKMWLRILAVEGCGLAEVTPHDLRRTFMTVCTELGYPPAIGDTLLGHSLGKITDTYTHLSMDGILSDASTDTALWIEAALAGKAPKNGKKVAGLATAKQA